MQKARRLVRGFTLIEILIVIVIIGIFVAIALPNFLAAQNRAKVSSLKSNMRTLSVVAQTYSVDWGGNYAENATVLHDQAVIKGYWKDLKNPVTGQTGLGFAISNYSQIINASLFQGKLQFAAQTVTSVPATEPPNPAQLFPFAGMVAYLPASVGGSSTATKFLIAGAIKEKSYLTQGGKIYCVSNGLEFKTAYVSDEDSKEDNGSGSTDGKEDSGTGTDGKEDSGTGNEETNSGGSGDETANNNDGDNSQPPPPIDKEKVLAELTDKVTAEYKEDLDNISLEMDKVTAEYSALSAQLAEVIKKQQAEIASTKTEMKPYEEQIVLLNKKLDELNSLEANFKTESDRLKKLIETSTGQAYFDAKAALSKLEYDYKKQSKGVVGEVKKINQELTSVNKDLAPLTEKLNLLEESMAINLEKQAILTDEYQETLASLEQKKEDIYTNIDSIVQDEYNKMLESQNSGDTKASSTGST